MTVTFVTKTDSASASEPPAYSTELALPETSARQPLKLQRSIIRAALHQRRLVIAERIGPPPELRANNDKPYRSATFRFLAGNSVAMTSLLARGVRLLFKRGVVDKAGLALTAVQLYKSFKSKSST